VTGSLKQIKNRIRGIESTAKITRAMEMVSAAKLRSCEQALRASRDYFHSIEDMAANIAGRTPQSGNKYLIKEDTLRKACLILVTSDTGLCSTYNAAVARLAEDFIKRSVSRGTVIIAVGKKGFDHFRRKGYASVEGFIGLQSKYKAEACERLYRRAGELFLEEKCPVYIAYTAFGSALNYRPKIERILPIEINRQPAMNYLFEPSAEALFEKLLPAFVRAKIKLCLLESFTSEHSSRAVAMKAATDNARELMKYLVLTRNKMRQASITKDVIEIISSAEALKG
jgi:F-type H+-transporting ATPase subunit gamma